jgi:hypothetical protein
MIRTQQQGIVGRLCLKDTAFCRNIGIHRAMTIQMVWRDRMHNGYVAPQVRYQCQLKRRELQHIYATRRQ